ncbi:galactosylceramide sulfotransferase-like isoform X2 [Mytilus californianus]|uniref:galactosylceramide sulfotransferase-like isoform X2 n=1 Tax=Mytilus californianus TaxID=6549 RepID=UPI0022482B2F|nr:galactosylceramide sulfotransferase-like isoform X2 [Mytilus californianus]
MANTRILKIISFSVLMVVIYAFLRETKYLRYVSSGVQDNYEQNKHLNKTYEIEPYNHIAKSSLNTTNNQLYINSTKHTKEVIGPTTLSKRSSLSINDTQNIELSKEFFKKVAFLKVHKAGSTTAQNIFLRYGESRNLTFVISRIRDNQYDNVISLQSSLNNDNILPPPPNRTFDILCCHVLYNNEAFHKYMPTDTAYIAIVREPFDQFLSTLNYFRPAHILQNIKAENKVFKYLQDPSHFEKTHRWSMTNNRMAFEFGFPSNLFYHYSEEESMDYLRTLDKEFQFVIIMEYFTESVVMMRRILGWTIKDVLYLKKNAARKSYQFVDNTNRYLYERFAKLDYDLYNFFYRRLWLQIEKEGLDFQLELLYFDRLREEVEDYCIFNAHQSKGYYVETSRWSKAFAVTQIDCEYLNMGEMSFVKKIRRRQYEYLQ